MQKQHREFLEKFKLLEAKLESSEKIVLEQRALIEESQSRSGTAKDSTRSASVIEEK